MNRSNTPKTLCFIIAFAIGLRIAVAITHPFLFPDSADYETLAKSLAHGGPYEVNGLLATRMPGYPLLAAALFAITGPSIKTLLILQAIMSGMIVWLVHAVARCADEQTALLAAALAALDPLSIGFSAAFLSETPFTLLLLLSLWTFIKLMERARFGNWLLVGLLWGAAVYMRASALWCIVPTAIWVAWKGGTAAWKGGDMAGSGGKWRGAGGRGGAALAIIVVFLTLLPWQIRNYSLFHSHFFRLTTLEGISLYEAVYPPADGSPQQDKISVPPEMQSLDEAARNDEWNRRAWHYVLTDPARMFDLALKKAARTWSLRLNAADFRSPALQTAMLAWYIPLFVLGLAGIAIKRVPMRIKGLLLIPVLYFTAVHSLFLGSVRYRVPLMPIICVFAAAGAVESVKWLRRGKRPTDAVV